MQRTAPSAQDMLREFAGLNARRRGAGVTPLEYQRWLDLGRRLETAFPDQPALAKKGKVRLLVEFQSESELEASVMMNVTPVGLFVHTPFPPDRGTKLDLRVQVLETGALYASRVVVISNNVGPDFSTQSFGMGLKFAERSCELRRALQVLCGLPAGGPDAEAETEAEPAAEG